MRKRIILLGCICIVLTACASEKVVMHPDFSNRMVRPSQTVLVRGEEETEIHLVESRESELISEYLQLRALPNEYEVVDRFEYSDGTIGVDIVVGEDGYRIRYSDDEGILELPQETVYFGTTLDNGLRSDTKEILKNGVKKYLYDNHIVHEADIFFYDFESVVIQIQDRPVALKIDTLSSDLFSVEVSTEEYSRLAADWLCMNTEYSVFKTVARDKYAIAKPSFDDVLLLVDRKGNIYEVSNNIGWQVDTPQKEMLKESLLSWKAFNGVEGDITVISIEDGYVDIAVDSQEKRLKLAIGCCGPDSEPEVLYLKNVVTWGCEPDERAEQVVWKAVYEDEYTGEVWVRSSETYEDGMCYEVWFDETDVRRLYLKPEVTVWDLDKH